MDLRGILRHDPAGTRLDERDPASSPLAPGKKAKTLEAAAAQAGELAGLQERLFAEATAGGERRLLVVLQGMDTSGKGGTIKHAIGAMNPQGVQVAQFKKPTDEELRHHFLWRIRRRVPGPGVVGVFDRSHYEDVLIARVHELAPAQEIERRYGQINAFEAKLADAGVTMVKVFLHLSCAEQRERLLARLEDPTKHWKFNPADLDERALWPDYQRAYEIALERCSTVAAPWYVVPADRKWYRNWAVGQLVLETLRELDPQYPQHDLDIAALRGRLQSEDK
jgi:PPK2 family polyphosphate:nucleotide phosphotransferase